MGSEKNRFEPFGVKTMSENYFLYETMFGIKTEFNPSDDELNDLAKFMTDQFMGIPAGYTYLGQFIDHDMSLDSASRKLPWEPIPASEVFNQRTPFLNLETIYGFEIPSNKDEPARSKLIEENSKTLLRLGNTVASGGINKVFRNKDLPRVPGTAKAYIVDSRNDENLVVAQTQVAFMRFHNSVVNYLRERGADDSVETFERARKIVIQHYQWIILHDYLPKIVRQDILDNVLNEGNQFYFPDAERPFMPLEFSVAAFRAGHSMIRDTYNWNIVFNHDPASSPVSLIDLTALTGRCGLNKNLNLPSQWVINWHWFFHFPGSPQQLKLNFASPINTKLVPLLSQLPAPGTGCKFSKPGEPFKRENSLAAFDLYRAKAMALPSGQAVAEKIRGTKDNVLKPEQIDNLLPKNLRSGSSDFSKETPLWFYLLAEAEIEEHGNCLGEVGSRIIAETLVELIRHSEYSILKEEFQPHPDLSGDAGLFGMPQMLEFTGKYKSEDFDELNPLKELNLCDEQTKAEVENLIFDRTQ